MIWSAFTGTSLASRLGSLAYAPTVARPGTDRVDAHQTTAVGASLRRPGHGTSLDPGQESRRVPRCRCRIASSTERPVVVFIVVAGSATARSDPGRILRGIA